MLSKLSGNFQYKTWQQKNHSIAVYHARILSNDMCIDNLPSRISQDEYQNRFPCIKLHDKANENPMNIGFLVFFDSFDENC